MDSLRLRVPQECKLTSGNRDFDRFNGYPLIDEKEELLTQISDITSWIGRQKVLIEQDEITIEMLEEKEVGLFHLPKEVSDD